MLFFYRFLVIIAHAITFTRLPHLFVHEFRGLGTTQKTNVKSDDGKDMAFHQGWVPLPLFPSGSNYRYRSS